MRCPTFHPFQLRLQTLQCSGAENSVLQASGALQLCVICDLTPWKLRVGHEGPQGPFGSHEGCGPA